MSQKQHESLNRAPMTKEHKKGGILRNAKREKKNVVAEESKLCADPAFLFPWRQDEQQ